MDNKLFLSSTVQELSEYKTYLELVDRVCFYDAPNLNNVMLPSDGALEHAQSLIDMPVYAKYAVNANGDPTFKGHEAYIDSDGDVSFNTCPIGTHVSVEIKNDDVDIGNGEIKNLPCLFAKQKIWTRNKNVVAAVKRLYEEGKLHNSWELVSSEYSFKDGIKTISDYVFEGNTFLGPEFSQPAYGSSAKVLSLSDVNDGLMIAEALSQDLIENGFDESEGEIVKKDEQNNVVVEDAGRVEPIENPEGTETVVTSEQTGESVTEQSEEDAQPSTDGVETSALTERDLRRKLSQAYYDAAKHWAYVAFHFPADKVVWFEDDYRESELDYVSCNYDVVNDDVVLGELMPCKLSVSIVDVNNTINNLNSEIEAKNSVISDMQRENESLKEYKEKYESEVNSKIRSQLIDRLESSKLFTEEEITSGEIASLIDNLDAAGVDKAIADKIVSSNSVMSSQNKNLHISSVGSDYVPMNWSQVMSDFFKK